MLHRLKTHQVPFASTDMESFVEFDEVLNCDEDFVESSDEFKDEFNSGENVETKLNAMMNWLRVLGGAANCGEDHMNILKGPHLDGAVICGEVPGGAAYCGGDTGVMASVNIQCDDEEFRDLCSGGFVDDERIDDEGIHGSATARTGSTAA